MTRKATINSLMTMFVLLSFSTLVLGQAVSGTLVGTVQDSSGAAVVKAPVTATQTETGTTYQTVTNDTGNYTIPSLPPGRYSVTVSAQGFKKETHENIDISC